ncbi:hypothetical protein M2139_000747 [Enterococcus sp. PF1-24]|uniref:DUF1827 family protein n=1 Tax=unclassified Enterococcus TaxID=2608891 RepID=UPI0024742025|nr:MULTISPECIES: DUF1827 family protein [unclassified Enterococcus]MDH6363630.1 hypothetical protein [Enterococcus sp. PFB1-1]MDH6400865.1 hypothetical protein [Enterococcus sp. PF1-24]
MKLVNVTNSHARLVRSQLENTDAQLVKVYSAGNTTVVFTQAINHNEILLINKKRNILASEISYVKKYFLKKLPKDSYDEAGIKVIEMEGLVEISIPKTA